MKQKIEFIMFSRDENVLKSILQEQIDLTPYINEQYRGYTMLEFAIENNFSIEFIEFLLQNDANIKSKIPLIARAVRYRSTHYDFFKLLDLLIKYEDNFHEALMYMFENKYNIDCLRHYNTKCYEPLMIYFRCINNQGYEDRLTLYKNYCGDIITDELFEIKDDLEQKIQVYSLRFVKLKL